MDKDTALDLALEVLQINLTLLEKINPYKGQEDLLSDSLELTHKAITAIKQARALDKMAEDARELGLDYEPAKYSDIVSDGGMDPRNQFDVPPTAQPAPVQPIGYEKYTAIREGHRNASEETYFAARPDLPLTTAMLKLFRDGFDRGYDTTPPAQPAPVQEPVAWIADTKRGYNTVGYECKKVNALPHGTMLYTTPPAAKRQWVGLTDDDYVEMGISLSLTLWQYKAIEAKLKEKNT
jgi:hypothetical protein